MNDENQQKPVHGVPTLSDTQLMAEVRSGKLDHLARLFERHHVVLYRYFVRLTGNSDLGNDMVQEVFLRILKYRHTFRDDGEFGIWMYRIARNVHLDHIRKWKMETPLNEDSIDAHDMEATLHAKNTMPDTLLEEAQEQRLLEQALAKLPVEKRELIILSRFQQLKYEAIGELLGCSVAAVKVRMHRAMNDLRGLYLELSGETRS